MERSLLLGEALGEYKGVVMEQTSSSSRALVKDIPEDLHRLTRILSSMRLVGRGGVLGRLLGVVEMCE
jgi:hypothetical protein